MTHSQTPFLLRDSRPPAASPRSGPKNLLVSDLDFVFTCFPAFFHPPPSPQPAKLLPKLDSSSSSVSMLTHLLPFHHPREGYPEAGNTFIGTRGRELGGLKGFVCVGGEGGTGGGGAWLRPPAVPLTDLLSKNVFCEPSAFETQPPPPSRYNTCLGF